MTANLSPSTPSSVAAQSGMCRNHVQREGIGVCVTCRDVFCSECITKIDGINYCRSCLGKLEEAQSVTPAPSASGQAVSFAKSPSASKQGLLWQRLAAYLAILFFFGALVVGLLLLSLSPALLARIGESL